LRSSVRFERPAPGTEDAFVKYALCREFRIKPSEIDKEKWKDVQELLVICDELARIQAAQTKSMKHSSRVR